MKKVYAAENPTMAHFVRNLLEAEGITARVQDEHLTIFAGGHQAGSSIGPAGWVLSDADGARAESIFEEQLSGDGAPAGEPWTCPGCGEKVEPQFTECWKCGGKRAGT